MEVEELAAPPTLKAAGELVFPDVDHPLPIKLLVWFALVLFLVGPVLIGSAAYRGRHMRRAIGMCLVGAFVPAAWFTWLSQSWGGMLGVSFTHRVSIWARYIWAQWFGAELVLSLAAAGAGRLIRYFRHGRERGRAA